MLKKFENRSFLIILLTTFVLLFFLGIYALISLNMNAKTAKLKNLQEELDNLNKSNSSIEYLLNEADESVLYERLARERGYVYADEKVYYDVTPGNWINVSTEKCRRIK